MAGIKFTKNELKRQKDSLKRFERYLPTLQLKKQQLQLVIRTVEILERERSDAKAAIMRELETWIEVFGQDAGLDKLLTVTGVVTDTGNIAGVDIPVFKSIDFRIAEYDLMQTPLWVDAAVLKMRDLAALDAEIQVLTRQRELLSQELRITSQRVNLFEKVKIPEARTNIRMIRIYLGDQQTAAVVRGKMSKNKLVS
jgi:V/A-type H+/Na+-transporting ATPase subunit D